MTEKHWEIGKEKGDIKRLTYLDFVSFNRKDVYKVHIYCHEDELEELYLMLKKEQEGVE